MLPHNRDTGFDDFDPNDIDFGDVSDDDLGDVENSFNERSLGHGDTTRNITPPRPKGLKPPSDKRTSLKPSQKATNPTPEAQKAPSEASSHPTPVPTPVSSPAPSQAAPASSSPPETAPTTPASTQSPAPATPLLTPSPSPQESSSAPSSPTPAASSASAAPSPISSGDRTFPLPQSPMGGRESADPSIRGGNGLVNRANNFFGRHKHFNNMKDKAVRRGARIVGSAKNVGQSIANTARKVVNTSVKLVQHLVAILSNPATWVVSLIVIAIMMGMTLQATLGDGGILCPEKSSTSAAAKLSKMIAWAQKTAADDSHGYSQSNRLGNPDYDCSSFVFYALTEGAGIAISGGAFSTKNMKGVLEGIGFESMDYDKSKLQKGDIVMYDVGANGHTEIYSGDNKFVGAHSPHGHPEAGDQGGEITESTNEPSNMQYILRYTKDDATEESGSASGSSGDWTTEGSQAYKNAKTIFDTLTNDVGFSGAGAAGALAVARRESNFDPTAKNAGGGVAGVFQWSGWGNTVNGTRIGGGGFIKVGDESTLTLENEMKLMKWELDGGKQITKTTVGYATDPVEAAKQWSLTFEGVALSDGQSKISDISTWAQQANSTFNTDDIQPDASKLGAKTGTVSEDGVGDGKNVNCMTKKNDDGGAISGEIPQDKYPYSEAWTGTGWGTYAAGQCTYWADIRRDQIGHKMPTGYMGNGQDWGASAKKYGLPVSSTPQAGDAASVPAGAMGSSATYGHVFIVEKVNADGSIETSEGGSGWGGSPSMPPFHRHIDKAKYTAANVQFVHW